MSTFLNKLSQHPFDWIIHATLCFVPIYFGWAEWFVVIFISVMLEYEQKFQYWNMELTWKEYFKIKSKSDLIADGIGIILGLIFRGLL